MRSWKAFFIASKGNALTENISRHEHKPEALSGQKWRGSSGRPALLKGGEIGLAPMAKAKALELLALCETCLTSHLPPTSAIHTCSLLLELMLFRGILLPPGRIRHTAPVGLFRSSGAARWLAIISSMNRSTGRHNLVEGCSDADRSLFLVFPA